LRVTQKLRLQTCFEPQENFQGNTISTTSAESSLRVLIILVVLEGIGNSQSPNALKPLIMRILEVETQWSLKAMIASLLKSIHIWYIEENKMYLYISGQF